MPTEKSLIHHLRKKRPSAIQAAHPLHDTARALLRNLLSCGPVVPSEGDFLEDLLERQALAREVLGYVRPPKAEALTRRWRRLRSGARPVTIPMPSARMGTNLATLVERLSLSELERDLLVFALTVREYAPFAGAAEQFFQQFSRAHAELVAGAVGHPAPLVRRALLRRERLASSGLVWLDREETPYADPMSMPAPLAEVLASHEDAPERLFDALLPVSPEVPLGVDDFAHLRADVDLARRILESALEKKTAGVNLLFFGDTGTGKTALASLLAKSIGSRLHVAGRAGDEGGNVGAQERLASLQLGQRLLSGSRALLLFDEIEDLFSTWGGNGPRSMSKQWFNWVLESNPIPTVWITNSLDEIDPAYLRRFAFSMELRRLGRRQRARVWDRQLSEAGFEPAPAETEKLAARHEASAAQIATAVSTTRLVSSTFDPALAGRLVDASERLVSGRRVRPNEEGPRDYRLDVLETSADLEHLTTRLTGWKPGVGPGPAMLFWGLPGTGKSEYARHLARTLDRPLHVRRCSDLLSKWIGETEKNLADAFHAAAEEGAVLVFDEADSFLRDRRGAQRSWEVTEVNEFLQQLERHPGIVVCTTNLLADLDAAALRRFAFKVEFRPLRPDGAFELFCDLLVRLDGPPAHPSQERPVRDRLTALGDLTPGDFAAVERRLRMLGEIPTVQNLLTELAAEVAVRRPARGIGFSSSA